jgi:2,3-bisphosphoglycerate-independent phosphoglycerate mutase
VARAHARPRRPRARPPTRTLRAHGLAVGLPSDDDMGNSEVGHNALGAGPVFEQGAKLVNQAIATGRSSGQETWRWLVDGARERRAPVHFLGLLSDGNVHSHIDHLNAMIAAVPRRGGASRAGAHPARRPRRPETSALDLRRRARGLPQGCPGGFDYRVASGGGRMKVTMDRYEADWAMVERGWAAHVHGDGGASARWPRPSRPSARESPRGDRPEPPGLRHRRRARRPGGPHPRRRLGGVLQLPRRPRDRDHPGLRARRRSRPSSGARAPRCATPG